MKEIILPSKLNTMSMGDLEMMDPNPFTPILEELMRISAHPSMEDMIKLKRIGGILAREKPERLTEIRKLPKYIYYSQKKRNYCFCFKVNGKTRTIKTSLDLDVVIAAKEKYYQDEGTYTTDY